jgi:hypothetical protein
MGFAEGLSPAEREASGLSKLNPAQTASLDALVEKDVTIAHQGGVTGFASAFTARRTPQELAGAGISTLNPSERGVLDVLAAQAIALGPPPEQAFTYSPAPQPTPAPAPKTAVPNPVISTLERMQIHGDLSFTVGGGSHGQSFYGTSMDVNATDPTGHFTIGVGLDDYKGRGLLYPPGPYPQLDPFYMGSPWLGW